MIFLVSWILMDLGAHQICVGSPLPVASIIEL